MRYNRRAMLRKTTQVWALQPAAFADFIALKKSSHNYKPSPPTPQVRKQLDMGKSIWGKIRTRPSPKPRSCYMCIYKSYFHNPKRLKPPAFQVLEAETVRHLWKTLSGIPCQSSAPWDVAHSWKSRWASGYPSCIISRNPGACMESKRMLGIF